MIARSFFIISIIVAFFGYNVSAQDEPGYVKGLSKKCFTEMALRLDTLNVPEPLMEHINFIKFQNPTESILKMPASKLAIYQAPPECHAFVESFDGVGANVPVCNQLVDRQLAKVYKNLLKFERWVIMFEVVRACYPEKIG